MRFTAASFAIVAGTALASQAAQETVYSTKAVTITSCAPDVPDCAGEDGVATQTSTVECEETPVWSTEYVTVTDYDSADCTSEFGVPMPTPSVPVSDVPVIPSPSVEVPVVPQPEPSDVQPEEPEEPVVPVPQEPITSTVTYSTCIPTVTSSVTVITPPAPVVPTGSAVPSVPVPSVPTGTGVVPGVPSNTPSPSGPVPPPFDSAAGSVGFSLFAGVAALAAFFL